MHVVGDPSHASAQIVVSALMLARHDAFSHLADRKTPPPKKTGLDSSDMEHTCMGEGRREPWHRDSTDWKELQAAEVGTETSTGGRAVD